MNDRFRFEDKYFKTELDPKLEEVKFRLYDKDRGCTKEYSLSKLIYTKFKRNKFEYRGMSTGLKDKNGRLIYEGDIVRLTRRKENILQKRGSCFQIRYLTHRFCGFGYGVNYRSVDMCLTESKAKCLEVIGNIHENPDLLDGGK